MKKILRFLIFGLSLFVILAAFKVGAGNGVTAVDYACPAPVGSVSNLTPNGTNFPAGTRSATLTWSAASQATNYAITVRTQSGQTLFADDNYPSTTVAISNLLTDGTSYIWLLRPKNNCESGNLFQATFSVAAAPTSCSNQGQCITCGNDDDNFQVCPELSNNCTAVCPGGTPGQFNCSISQSLQSAPNLYTLTGNPSNLPNQNYNWDLDGNYVYNDAQGPTLTRNFSTYTNIRLQVRDLNNNVAVCSTTINPSSTIGTVPTCNLYANPSSGVAPLYVSLTSNAQAPAGRSITGYSWDLDGNGSFGDNGITSSTAQYTYNYSTTPRLQVTDSAGVSNTCPTTITITNQGGGQICTTDVFRCADGSYVSRNPNNSCQFNTCPNTGTQCRSMTCSAQTGCYYTNPSLTYSCDPNAQLCGQLICNQQPSVPNIPTFPAGLPFSGNFQNTDVNVANANANANSNFNDSFSDSSSSATGGYSWASAGAGGFSNVNINW